MPEQHGTFDQKLAIKQYVTAQFCSDVPLCRCRSVKHKLGFSKTSAVKKHQIHMTNKTKMKNSVGNKWF